MSADDHLGLQFYEGHMSPRKLVPSQVYTDQGEVARISGSMREHGYQSSPIDTRYRNGEVRVDDGHHRREAAIGAGLASVPVTGFSSHGIPPGTSEIPRSRYDEIWETM